MPGGSLPAIPLTDSSLLAACEAAWVIYTRFNTPTSLRCPGSSSRIT